MPKYKITFEATLNEYGDITLTANNEEDARELAKEYVSDAYDNIKSFVLTGVEELV